MRTTIDLLDEQRAELLRMAAKRGIKGFSLLIQEAVAAFIGAEGGHEAALARALAARGRLSDEDAEALRQARLHARQAWR